MDIDIDFANRDQILSTLDHTVAILKNNKKHNTGVYVTEIPKDPVTNYCTIDYKKAEQRGYFKLDFLNVSLYKDVKDETHLIKLIETEPLWDLLEHKIFIDKLFHLSGHSDIVIQLKPRNIEQLAAVLAIIRPAKRYLQKDNWDFILDNVWIVPNDGSYYFKKAHAISYAVAVIVHMNLLCAEFTPS